LTIEEAEKNMGKKVIYRPGDSGYTNRIFTIVTPEGNKTGELGIIDDTNERYVFVLYTGDRHAKATAPHDLTLIT